MRNCSLRAILFFPQCFFKRIALQTRKNIGLCPPGRMRSLLKTLWEKEKNSGKQHFLPFSQYFLPFTNKISIFSCTFYCCCCCCLQCYQFGPINSQSLTFPYMRGFGKISKPRICRLRGLRIAKIITKKKPRMGLSYG